ncbi:zinc ribbon domain-containing protein [Haloprofundus salinisoli]|uniref:zinc ribbon domain-containing protein n=1 Tax=Haloprofundus salinisoli TaxID=2876193 RepID=UPI001CCC2F45|nr:zinc ribbon domain-containing protein [Haloprofundus salinisoli]
MSPRYGTDERIVVTDGGTSTTGGCGKCGGDDAAVGKVATTSPGSSTLLGVEDQTYHVVTCTNCGYSEFYDAFVQPDDEASLVDQFFE